MLKRVIRQKHHKNQIFTICEENRILTFVVIEKQRFISQSVYYSQIVHSRKNSAKISIWLKTQIRNINHSALSEISLPKTYNSSFNISLSLMSAAAAASADFFFSCAATLSSCCFRRFLALAIWRLCSFSTFSRS